MLGSGLGNYIGNDSATTNVQEAKDMLTRANEYATSIKDQTDSGTTATFKDLTDYSKVQSKIDTATNRRIVGPFRWTFSGTIDYIRIYRDSASDFKRGIYCVYEGTKLVNKNFKDLTSSEAEKGFYIPTTVGSEIKSMKVHQYSTSKSATIWFLEPVTANWQNLIYFEPDSGNTTVDNNINLTGNLKIKKVDSDTGNPLSGVGFKIKQASTGKYVKEDIVDYDNDGKVETKKYISYVSESDATEFTTNDSGNITINGLTHSEYQIIETKNSNPNYILSTDLSTSVKVQKGKTKTVTIKNKKQLIPDLITPITPDEPTPIERSLIISGYVWKDYIGNQKVSQRDNKYDSSDEMIANGEVEVSLRYENGIVMEHTQQNPQQTNDGKYAFVINFPNAPEELNLEPLPEIGSKPVKKEVPESVTNEEERRRLEEQYENEYRIEVENYNERVNEYNEIVQRNNSLIAEYEEKVEEYNKQKAIIEEKVKTSYIEFAYNGFTYANVTPMVKTIQNGKEVVAENSSKASENTLDRTNLNEKFFYIEGTGLNTGVAIDKNKQKSFDLTYQKGKYQSTDVLVTSSNLSTTIIASTQNAGFNMGDLYEDNKLQVTKNGITKTVENGVTTITNINLGLYEREQPDLAIATDVQEVQVYANGKQHTYEYAKRFASDFQEDIYGISWKEKYNDSPDAYKRPIYRADVEKDNEEGREFEVYVVYHISIKNQSDNLKARVNSIINYYDKRYSVIQIGTNYENHTVTGTELAKTPDGTSGDYSKMIVTMPTDLFVDAEQATDVYIKYKLEKSAVEAALDRKDDPNELFKNISEINSYSIFDENTKPYAGIDTDSNPGNAIPEEGAASYEDDTDEAPPFKITEANERTVTGTAFLDASSQQTNEDGSKERIYDGEYQEDTDKPLKNVKVMLIEDKENGKIVSDGTTNEKGEFTLTNYPAGDYKLSYQWGVTEGEGGTSYKENDNEIKINVQNYKATVYKDKNRQENPKWYLTTEPRYSDALDTIETREKIDEEIATIEANEKYMVDENGTITPNFGIFENKQMTSTTPGRMDIGIENQESNYTEDGTIRQTYEIKNADFGIAERPKQDLDIEKEVTYVKITLDNALTLIETRISNGKIEKKVKSLAYQGPQKNAEGTTEKVGFVKAEIDNEIAHSINLQATYTITVKNDSELDYQSENYYHYGEISEIIQDKKIGMIPSNILDYVDSGWSIESINDEESGWKEYTESGIPNQRNTKTISNQTMSTQELKPSSSNSIFIKVSKEVAVGQQEFNIGNKAQIIKITRPKTESTMITGRIPEALSSAEAEEIIVTPNTGANKNITLQIMIAILSLATIMGGIILIKKKVLGK